MSTERTFTCVKCERTFACGWTAAEAEAEMKRDFGQALTRDDCDILCHECYREFQEWLPKWQANQ